MIELQCKDLNALWEKCEVIGETIKPTDCSSTDPESFLQEDAEGGVAVCVTKCTPGFYGDEKERKCKKCLPGCKACSDGSKCDCIASPSVETCCKLNEGYISYDEHTGTCSTECEGNQYFDSSACRDCHEDCQTCSFSTECEVCKNGAYAMPKGSRTRCEGQCPNGYKAVEDPKRCKKCTVDKCETCSASVDTCDACPAGMVLHQNQCLSSCPDNLSKTDNNRCTQVKYMRGVECFTEFESLFSGFQPYLQQWGGKEYNSEAKCDLGGSWFKSVDGILFGYFIQPMKKSSTKNLCFTKTNSISLISSSEYIKLKESAIFKDPTIYSHTYKSTELADYYDTCDQNISPSKFSLQSEPYCKGVSEKDLDGFEFKTIWLDSYKTWCRPICTSVPNRADFGSFCKAAP